MMQCVRRCSFICGAVLSILLLLCSCQAGAGQLILPDNVPSENTSQGKKELLAALNQEYFDQFSSPNHFIQGSDDAAKTVFLYLKQYSGDDINKAVEALTENPKDDRANCADDVLRIISPSPSETYWVSYSFLSADMLEDGVLKENAAFGSVAKDLIGHRRFLVLSELFIPPPARMPALPSASSAVRRSLWLCSFPDSIFQDKQKMTAAVSCSAAVILSVHPIGRTILYSYNKGSCQRLSTEKKLAFC